MFARATGCRCCSGCGEIVMKVLHIILLGAYTDGFSYQENLLPKYHQKAGHEVEIIASSVVVNDSGQHVDYDGPGRYTDQNGIAVTRLPFRAPKKLSAMFRRYKGLYAALESASPDVLFIHGCQFLEIKTVARYLKRHPHVIAYVDNHADFNNSAQNVLSKKVLHGVIWKRCAHIIEPFTKRFYGVLPARVDFLREAYGLPEDKCALLVMGVDDEEAQKALVPAVRRRRREEYGVTDSDFVVVTGGKIDSNKPQVITLMKAINQLTDRRLRLVVFGSVSGELKADFDRQLSERVSYIGWRKSNEIYTDFAAADLVAFPGLHSVLWEEAAGMGKPCAFKRIKGFEHVDLGGNCLFFENDSAEEYQRVICQAQRQIDALKAAAEEKGMNAFSYRKIAERALDAHKAC